MSLTWQSHFLLSLLSFKIAGHYRSIRLYTKNSTFNLPDLSQYADRNSIAVSLYAHWVTLTTLFVSAHLPVKQTQLLRIPIIKTNRFRLLPLTALAYSIFFFQKIHLLPIV